MNEMEYLICELVYEAAIASPIAQRKMKAEIAELSYLLAQEDLRRLEYDNALDDSAS